MFRLFGSEGNKELRELSLKQREQFLSYTIDRVERTWPQLRASRPEPVAVPPRNLEPETPRNTPT